MTNSKSKYTRALYALLVISLSLRIVLIFSGGQYFWPDEDRYENSRLAAEQLLAGNKRGAIETLHTAVNPLYGVLSVLPAIAEHFIGEDLRIPAIFFASFSVLNLWLLGLIVLALGAEEREALLATLLLALSSTFFFYSRHLLPYDTALTFGFLSILVGIKRPAKTTNSVLSGLLALFAFLVYTGYWAMVVFSFLTHVFFELPNTLKERARRALLWGSAFVLPLLAVLALSNLLFENPLLSQFLLFTSMVTQGLFAEGWSLPFEYLWHAEHLIMLFWFAAFIFAIRKLVLKESNKRIAFGLLGFLVIYIGLVAFSVILEKFVVYGRSARQLVPFLCILGAYGLESMWIAPQRIRRLAALLFVGIALQAAVNFWPVFVQDFPIEFRETATAYLASTDEDQFEFLYAGMIYPEPAETIFDRPYQIRLQSRHPLQFLPYQYEGYTPAQRQLLRSMDISMRLIVFENSIESTSP